MKRIALLVAMIAFAGATAAGEDSTQRYGAGGTGPAWYDSACDMKRPELGDLTTPTPPECQPRRRS